MRINHVGKARKDQGNCQVCHEPIPAGSAYQYIEPRYGPRQVRHASCRTWRPSEMTSSKMAEIMAAQEAFGDDTYNTLEDLGTAVMAVGEAARSVGEEYEESAQNMEDGFGHETSTSEEVRDKAREITDWADELEQLAGDLEAEDLVCTECGLDDEDDMHQHEFEAKPANPAEDWQGVAPRTVCAHENCEQPEEAHHAFEGDMDEPSGRASELVDACPV